MNYDTLTTPYAGCSNDIKLHDRRIIDTARLRQVYGRFAAWESERRVLRNQIAPMIIWILFWATVNWAAGWSFDDAVTTTAPVQTQTQSQTQAQPLTFGCR